MKNTTKSLYLSSDAYGSIKHTNSKVVAITGPTNRT